MNDNHKTVSTEKVTSTEAEGDSGESQSSRVPESLTARTEAFDSYWQAPDDVEEGYEKFYEYYKYNFLPQIPDDKNANILVVSCGPGYLVNLLDDEGYSNVLGIDSDPAKIEYATDRGLNCKAERAFSFLADREEEFDVVICEQELNHLTMDEMVDFLKLCWQSLRPGGKLVVYGLNGANPIVGAENLAHNIDHFSTFTEYSLEQVLESTGFQDIELFPLQLYVFWMNPLNYVGLAATSFLSLLFRIIFILYGKNAKIFSKKIAASCVKGD